MKKLTQQEVIYKLKQIHKNKFRYDKMQYINSRTKIEIYCNKCKKYFWQKANDHLNGHGCPYCVGRYTTAEEFILQAKKIHRNKYDYSEIKTIDKKKKIKILCNKCKCYFSVTPANHINGSGCPYCQFSKGEEKIKDILIDNNILFISQKRFKNCKDKKPLPFDFYLPDYNTCIEYQGIQHYDPLMQVHFCKSVNRGNKKFKKQKLHDKIKKDYCKKYNINFLEIKYNENIEAKLKKYLNILS